MVAQLWEVLKIVSPAANSRADRRLPRLRKCSRSRCLFGPELGSHSTVPRQNQKSKGFMVKRGLLGPEQVKRLAPASQQWQKNVGEPRPPGIAKNSTTTEASSGKAVPSWPRAYDMDSAVAAAAVESAGEVQPPGIAKRNAVAEREFAKSSGGVGPSWSTFLVQSTRQRRRSSRRKVCWESSASFDWKSSVPRQSRNSQRVAAELDCRRCSSSKVCWWTSVLKGREVQRHLRIRVRTRR